MPQLTPPVKFRAVGADGLALVGGKVFTYLAGTSTPKATYTSYTLASPNTNPVILDARGEADIWLDGSYKIILQTAAGVQIWSVDDIRDITANQTLTGATLAGTLTVTSTAVTWSGNPTHSGNHTFTNNVAINGNVTLGDASSDSLTINPNAVTWNNPVTHSNAHTFSGNVTVNGTAAFPLAASTHTFGLTVGNVARADTSTLDWYQEGTVTMSIAGSTVAGTASYGGRTLEWTRIGNRVFVNLYLDWFGFTGTGNIVINGALPFQVAGGQASLNVTAENLTYSNTLTALVSVSTLTLYTQSTGAGLAAVPVDIAASVTFSGSYRTV